MNWRRRQVGSSQTGRALQYFAFVAFLLTVLAGPHLWAQNATLVVVNGASFKRLVPVSPSSIATAFPVAPAVFTGVSEASAVGVPLPTVLAGTQIIIGGTPAPLFYVSSSQINFQLPRLISLNPPESSISVVVNGVTVAHAFVTVFPTGAGMFAALNQNGSQNSSSNRASLGSVLQLFGTGFGEFTSMIADGHPNPSNPLATTKAVPEVWIGLHKVQNEFSGGAPGLVGVNQINVRLPSNPNLIGRQWLFAVVGGQVSERIEVWIGP